MKTHSTRALWIAGVALAALSGSGARAQGAAPAQAEGTAVSEIVVTAEKRSENAQNVAGQLTALTAKSLEDIQAHTFADFANFVPGLSFQSGGPTNTLIAIRGITTGGSQLSSAVGIYLDEIPIGASTSFGLGAQSFDFNTFDLRRVEVLNGPQGTLYGANALGGTVKYVTNAPDTHAFAAAAEAEGSYTEHGSWNDGLRVMANLPLADGKVAVRVVGLQEFDSGYTDDPTHGRHDNGSARTLGGRLSILADLTPDLDVQLSAFSQRIIGRGFDVSFRDPVTHQPVAGAYDQSFVLSQPSDNSVTAYSAVVNWDLHFAKLTSVTGYQRNEGSYSTDVSDIYSAFFPGIPFALPVDTSTKKFTQEFRIASPEHQTLEWVGGLYFTREITDEDVLLIDAAAPGGTLYGAYPFNGYLPSTYRELAVFADATYHVTSRFDMTLGVRYSQNHQVYSSAISSLFFPNPFAVEHYSAGSDQGVATYLINPRYRITDDTMVYARISSGFRPGGPNFVLPTGFANPVFQPDTLWNYELGQKSTLLGGKATLDTDIYDIEWSNVQITVNNGGINQLENAGNARIQGAEAEFRYRVLPPLTLGGSTGFTDAHLTTTAPIVGVGYTGARLPLSPKYQFALNADYRFTLGGGYFGDVVLTDAWIGDRTNGFYGSATNYLYKLSDYNTFNVNLALFAPHNVEVDLYVKNLFDTRGEVSASTVANEYNPASPVPVTLSQPRTVGLVLKARL